MGTPSYIPSTKAARTICGYSRWMVLAADQITDFKSDTISSFRFSPDGKTIGVLRSHVESDVVLLRDAANDSR